MKKTALYLWLSMAFFTAACSIDNQDDIDDIGNVTDVPFTEGIIEMGMYSHGIDIGHYIKNIDFSRDDAREQLEALIEEAGPEIGRASCREREYIREDDRLLKRTK